GGHGQWERLITAVGRFGARIERSGMQPQEEVGQDLAVVRAHLVKQISQEGDDRGTRGERGERQDGVQEPVVSVGEGGAYSELLTFEHVGEDLEHKLCDQELTEGRVQELIGLQPPVILGRLGFVNEEEPPNSKLSSGE